MKRNLTAIKTLFPAWLSRALLVLFLFSAVRVQALQNSASTGIAQGHQDIFDTLINITPDKRVETAQNIYKKNCRQLTVQAAMQKLDGLTTLARKLGDLPLECSVFDMRADYYSVNRKFNPVSTSYYQQAIDFARDNKMQLEKGIYLQHKAIYYYVYRQNVTACEYFLQARDVFKAIGYDNVPSISLYFSEFGMFYYSIGDYTNARALYKEALLYKPASPRNFMSINNTLGLIYRNFREYPPALDYFARTLKYATEKHDTVWAAIAAGNIGSVYFMQDDYEKALPYVRADYVTSAKYKEHANAAFALMRLVKISMNSNKLDEAKKQLDTAQMLIKSITADALPVELNYNELMSEYYERMGQAANALSFREKYDDVKDSLTKRDNIAAVEAVRLRSEIDKRMAQLAKVKTEAQIDALKRNTVIVLLILSIIISILLFNRHRQKAQVEKGILEAEKQRIDEELANAVSELMHYTESLQQKNMMIDRFASEIETLKERYDDGLLSDSLEKLLDAHLMTDESWTEFKRLFSKVYPGFFQGLRNSFPNLSENDNRLLSLIKLGLSNREMANMLGVTIEGIKKAKQRLRKKMEIAVNTELESVIAVI